MGRPHRGFRSCQLRGGHRSSDSCVDVGMEQLEREIERLEGRLAGGRTVDELATVRRGLASGGPRGADALPNVRIGFACKQRWEDMVGDERVRACAGCDRPVFNLSAMTRDEAEAVLATRGLTPCVRFYRRPDGTVMTSDCPTAARPARRLAVVASSLAGATLAAAPAAMADPPAADVTAPAGSDDTATGSGSDAPVRGLTITEDYIQGLPAPTRTFEGTLEEVGVLVTVEEKRPAIEWSL